MPLPIVPMPKYAIFVIIDPSVVFCVCPLLPGGSESRTVFFPARSAVTPPLTQIMTQKVLENVT